MPYDLYQIYHKNIPTLIMDLANTPAMQRLRSIGMNCGCEYTNIPIYKNCFPYSRYEHSLGVALIIYHFTQDIVQAISGLFHDISTPTFAHTIDFLNGDYITQESTEADTATFISASNEIMQILNNNHINISDITDYHRYPIADNDSPRLSSDRLEYSLGNILEFGFAGLDEVYALYNDLTVLTNEDGQPELGFRTLEKAERFTELSLKNSYIFTSKEDRCTMQFLSTIMQKALDLHVITNSDLYKTEPYIIRKLLSHPDTRTSWEDYCNISQVMQSDIKPGDGWIQVDAKKRYINPLVQSMGRIASISSAASHKIDTYRNEDFSSWLQAIP